MVWDCIDHRPDFIRGDPPIVWAAEDRVNLPDAARALLLDAEVEPLFSAASIWEVAIKSAI